MRLLSVLAVAALACPAHAQIRASEPASFAQTIDGTKITIQYSRPRARGRDPLFGSADVVRWNEVWTPGANYATTLEVNRPIKLEGRAVKPGTYSVWMVVRQSGDWTMVLDPKARVYHMFPPDSSDQQIRFPIHAHEGPFTEILTWSVPEIRADGGTLAMQWGRTRVDMQIDVEPSLRTTMDEADAQPYLGEYVFSRNQRSGGPVTSKFFVVYEQNTLKGYWEPDDGYYHHFALIRIAPDWFSPGVYDQQGKIYEVYRPDLTVEFKRDQGRVMSLEIRMDNDAVWGTAKRVR